jgi:5-methylcytosine-specific restriction endonuclease McrA
VRVCSGAGCLRVVPDKVRFCGECVTERLPKQGNIRAREDEIQREYVTHRWNKGIRPRVLKQHPFCAVCDKRVSQVADHIIPAHLIVQVCRDLQLFPFDPMGGFYIMANLQGLCHSCHNAKTRVEDGQDWSAHLAKVLAPYIKHAAISPLPANR